MKALVFLSLAALLLTAAACGDDDAGGATAAPDADSPLFQMLSAVPDDPENPTTYIGWADYERYYEAFGVSAPPRDPSQEQLDEWLGEVAEQGDGLPLGTASDFVNGATREAPAFRDELGFDFSRITHSLEIGSPPATVTILYGDFDEGAIATAVNSDPAWSADLEDAEHGGVQYYTWLEDFRQNLDRTSAARPLGRGGRLALYEKMLVWSLWTEGLTSTIDAATDAAPSLADRANVGELTWVLDDRNAYYLVLFAAEPGEEVDVPAAFLAESGGVDSDGPFMLLVLGNADHAAAEENEGFLRSHIESGRDVQGNPLAQRIDSIDVESIGPLTVATMRGPNLPFGAWAASGLDALFGPQ